METSDDSAALLLSLGATLLDRETFDNDLVDQLAKYFVTEDNAVPVESEADLPPQDDDCQISSSLLVDVEEDVDVTPLLVNDKTNSNSSDDIALSRPKEKLDKNFGADTTDPPAQSSALKKDTLGNFNKYLQDQLQQQQKKDGDGVAGGSRRKLKKTKIAKKHKKDALDMKVLFPKKRKRKEKLGLAVSSDPSVNRMRPGKSAAESTSMYLNENEDSDYVPSELEDNGDSDYAEKKTLRKPSKKKEKRPSMDSDDNESYDSDSDYDQRSKRLKRETDDGNFSFYSERVTQWKNVETRLNDNFKTFEGGFKLPRHMWDGLYQYQKVGVKWLWELHAQRCGGILGDEMGLGKTIQVINFLAGLSCSNMQFRMSQYRGLGPVLLITPATVMHQWVKEFHTWWPPFRVAVLHESGSYSGSKISLINNINQGNGILVTSYSGLVNNQNQILSHSWHYVILDEGHKIRNPDAQMTLVAKQVKTPHRLILSGSPLQNNLKELWSLFDFISPSRLGTLPAFMESFSIPITQGGYANATQVQVAVAYKCAKALRDIINPYVLRRMKSDVKDHINLPAKNEQVLFCKMADKQRELYKEYIASREIHSILRGNSNLFVGLINLRKICNHPHLFDGGPKIIVPNPKYKHNIPKIKSGIEDSETLEHLDDDEGDDIDVSVEAGFGSWKKSGKMIVVETLLKLWHKQGHKVLLFTQSRQMLCILENFVRQSKYAYLRLDGSTSVGARQPLITKFNEDPNVFIFILTTRVGGLGVNLTAANRVILFDPDWNPSTDIQARERAWRIGQSREVTIYRLILSGTIEEKMYHRQVFKTFLTNRVLKDPKQKRFFKSNDMLELFTLNEGTKGTESEAIFAGTGSKIKMPKRKPKEKSSGKFKDVPHLVKQRKGKEGQSEEKDKALEPETTSTARDTTKHQDDYVLGKLFRKSGVEAALRHDKIVDTDEADYMIVEKEAEAVATQAVEKLKRSREACWGAESGNVNWTGSQGERKPVEATPQLRFGKKKVKPVKKDSTEHDKASKSATTDDKYFTGQAMLKSNSGAVGCPGGVVLSSSDLLSIIRARKGSLSTTTASSSQDGVDGPDVKEEQLNLLRDIREFLAFQAMVDGQATTEELVQKFGPRLPNGQSPLFKHMLNQICTFRRVDGQGMWRLKPEFR